MSKLSEALNESVDVKVWHWVLLVAIAVLF